jgi:uncharacterized membrane protein YidH (DUF202 family)
MNNEKYYLIAKERLRKQLETVDIFKVDINTLLVVCGILIAFFSELALTKDYILGIGVPFIIVSMGILLFSFRITEWQDSPNPERVFFDLQRKTNIDNFYEEATKDIVECYKENKILLDKKADEINLSNIFLIVGISLTIVGVIIHISLTINCSLTLL